MHIARLALPHFRNYARLELQLPARIHLFQGANAQGKTNLLEAVYYLATTKSPLASSDRELIQWDADKEVIPFARVSGTFHRAGTERSIEITLQREATAASQGDTLRKQVLLDGVRRRAMDVLGTVNEVLFLPEDIALISGSPGERRRYLDVMLCQLDPVYCRPLSRYGKVIAQRNALLRDVRQGRSRVTELAYWDDRVADLGAYLLCQRLWAVDELGQEMAHIQPDLTGGDEQVELRYLCSADEYARADVDLVSERASPGRPAPEAVDATREVLARALHGARRSELARGVTIVGPHRDDLRFLLNGHDATLHGSRGQQRTLALAIKLAEVALMTRVVGESPILLLDDVLSELDERRAAFMLDTISRADQVLLTATDLHAYARRGFGAMMLWRVENGGAFEVDGPAGSA